MGIGAQIGGGALNMAVDLSLAAFGVAVLSMVAVGIIILFNIGSHGFQQHVRGLVGSLFWGFLFTGGAQVIARGAQKVFALGTGG